MINLKSFGDAFGTNLALAIAGEEARWVVDVLLGYLSDDDIAFAVMNSVDVVKAIPDDTLAQLRRSLKKWQPFAEIVLKDNNLLKFLTSASPHHAALLDTLPGGVDWLRRQVVSLL